MVTVLETSFRMRQAYPASCHLVSSLMAASNCFWRKIPIKNSAMHTDITESLDTQLLRGARRHNPPYFRIQQWHTLPCQKRPTQQHQLNKVAEPRLITPDV